MTEYYDSKHLIPLLRERAKMIDSLLERWNCDKPSDVPHCVLLTEKAALDRYLCVLETVVFYEQGETI